MKRCPQCYDVYDDLENYCDSDGQRLLVDPTFSMVEDETESPVVPEPARNVWLTGVVGILVGVLISVGLYFASTLWSFDSNKQDNESPVYASQSRGPSQPATQSVEARGPDESSEAVEESSTESDAEASGELVPDTEPAQDDQSMAARLNKGPVSTGERDKAQVAGVLTIIQMIDGTSIEVDAAWQDKQGIWYRRGGLVSFVESQRVKAITGRAEPKVPSPEPATP